MKWALTDKFHDYLYAQSFIIYKNNNPITYVFTFAKLNGTTYCWVAELVEFNIKVKYSSGKSNVDAVTVARMPINMESYHTKHKRDKQR